MWHYPIKNKYFQSYLILKVYGPLIPVKVTFPTNDYRNWKKKSENNYFDKEQSSQQLNNI